MKGSFIILLVFLSSSLLAKGGGENNEDAISMSYTFCKSGSSAALIELKLNEDGTFLFKDFSNPSKEVDAQGKYKIEGSKISLFDYDSNFPIAKVWKMDADYPCIKSRKGIEFTRICNCE